MKERSKFVEHSLDHLDCEKQYNMKQILIKLKYKNYIATAQMSNSRQPSLNVSNRVQCLHYTVYDKHGQLKV